LALFRFRVWRYFASEFGVLKPLQLYFFNAGAIDFGDVEFEVFEAQRFI
jgi:hypothetical protein